MLPAALPPLPQYQLDRKMDEPLIDWMFCRQISCLCQDVQSRSSSLYRLHYTDNATQTPTLSPFNSDLNLICVPCNMALINSAFRKVWWEFFWYFSLLWNLRNMLMENKIVNLVLHKNDTLWNMSKWRSKNDQNTLIAAEISAPPLNNLTTKPSYIQK